MRVQWSLSGVLCVLPWLVAAMPAGASSALQDDLSMADRLACQQRLQEVYWRHTNWPASNPGSKPPFEKMMTLQDVERQVEKGVLATIVLEEDYGIRIDARTLQGEMNRMARDTKSPGTLRELFAALGDDPVLVGECLARPLVTDRLLRRAFAFDRRRHGEIGDRARHERSRFNSAPDLRRSSGILEETTLHRPQAGEEMADWDASLKVLGGRFQLEVDDGTDVAALLPATGISDVQEEEDRFVVQAIVEKTADSLRVATVSWRKRGYDDWLQDILRRRRGVIARRESASVTRLTLPAISLGACSDAWSPTRVDRPDGRNGHSMIWTGTEAIVWGGSTGFSNARTGARYDPTTDTWTFIPETGSSPSARAGHSAVWTGTEMLIWGGSVNTGGGLNTGGRFDPLTGTWTPMTLVGAPAARTEHTAVWTGAEMIVWGGLTNPNFRNDGGRYNPASNSWQPTSLGANVPSLRAAHTAVWTGSRMVIWGGRGPLTNTGGRYDPVADSWLPTVVDGTTPSPRWAHTAVWTGTEMVVWGGYLTSNATTNTGGRYDPLADTWSMTSTGTGVPAGRFLHAAVWTGSGMLVWGGAPTPSGYLGDGAVYHPSSDSWSAIAAAGAPSPRTSPGFVWTGSELMLWGGFQSGVLRSGGRYNPASDSWSPVNSGATPDGRYDPTAVSTGTQVIVWGGFDGGVSYNTGGRYDLATDSWLPTSTSGAPSARHFHGAVWTGARMMVWGGYSAGAVDLDTGGLYDPLTDTWSSTSTVNAPAARRSHSMLWTGTEALVWGGLKNGLPSEQNTGGLYNPSTGTWRATSTGTGVPQGRYRHSTVWTGTEMIVWGGFSGGSQNTGGRYNPVSDSWTPTSTGAGVPTARRLHQAVWTGSRMIVWGGETTSAVYFNSGGKYDPGTDAWSPTSIGANVPSPRYSPAAVWTGTDMLVWGGVWAAPGLPMDGGRYFPGTDNWIPTPIDANTPAGRDRFSWVWADGSDRLVVWGGLPLTATGGVLCPCQAQTWFRDLDGDGHGTASQQIGACAQPAGYASAPDDCDDASAARFPGNPELCDGIDNDCNLVVDDAATPAAAFLLASKSEATIFFDWAAVPGASSYDAVRGGLTALRVSAGDFSTATNACLADNVTTPSISDADTPIPNDGFWYAVRGGNCAGPGTYDEDSGTAQQGSRDAEIAASGLGCP